MLKRFQNAIEQSLKKGKWIPPTHKYMTTHFPCLVQALQY